MTNQILYDSIYHLYRSHIVDLCICLALIIAGVLVTVGVIKFQLLNTFKKQILLVFVVAVCSVGLILLQAVPLYRLHKDYEEQSYIVLDDAALTVTVNSRGFLNKESEVVVKVDGTEINLVMETDIKLDVGKEYKGTVAYLENSGYVIWYDFE